MNLNDWEFIWRRQEPPEGVDADIERLRESFDVSHRRLERALLVRDVSESLAGVFAAAVMGAFGWHMGRSGWPFILVVALILGVSAFFVRERIRTRRIKPDPGASVLEKVDSDLQLLRRSRKLLATIAVWYIAPLFLSELIVVVTIASHAKPWDLQRDPVFMGVFILFLAAVNAWAWDLNRRALRKRIEPRIAELEKLRGDLLSTSVE
jgi:MFS family permease